MLFALCTYSLCALCPLLFASGRVHTYRITRGASKPYLPTSSRYNKDQVLMYKLPFLVICDEAAGMLDKDHISKQCSIKVFFALTPC